MYITSSVWPCDYEMTCTWNRLKPFAEVWLARLRKVSDQKLNGGKGQVAGYKANHTQLVCTIHAYVPNALCMMVYPPWKNILDVPRPLPWLLSSGGVKL